MAVRLIKIAMVASCALFALMVAFNNLADYGSNFAFVRHVLGMDTTFPDNALKGRAIDTPWMWTAGYWLIIATEALTGLLLGWGAVRLVCHATAPAARFNAAKTPALLGVGLGFLLWFTGFMVVGGEWFLMWQSATWNGQQAAFRFYMTLLVVGLFLNQPDQDLA